MSLTIESIPLAHIVASKTNPRKNFDQAELQGLADDIADKGVLQNILVRPLPNGLPLGETGIYEIVFGERRYRASLLAGKTEIPAEVRELTDRQALEIQMVENLKRIDLDPLEESEGYQAMLEYRDAEGKQFYTVEMLSSAIKKHKTHIYGRIQLRNLPAAAKAALLVNQIPIATAILIARIPSEEARTLAAKEILQPRYQDQPMSRDKAQKYINENYMRQLKGAPFDTTDPTLVPQIGACTTCPYRTGNAPELYGDVQRGDICTNPSCFIQKSDVTWARVQANAEKSGKKVLSGKEAEGVFSYDDNLSWDSQYIDLKKQPAATDLAPETKNPPSWKKLLAKAPCEVPIVLARDKSGKVHELVERKHAIEAAKQAAAATGTTSVIAEKNSRDTHAETQKAQEKAAREKAKLDQAIARAVMQAVVDVIELEDHATSGRFIAPLLDAALKTASSDGCYWVRQRRGIPAAARYADPELILQFAAELTGQAKIALIVELLLARQIRWGGAEAPILAPWIAECGVDVPAIATEIKNAKKPKPAKKPGVAKAKKSEKPKTKKATSKKTKPSAAQTEFSTAETNG